LVSIFSSIFVAELHKVVAASALPNIAVMRLSYHHHGTKEMQRLFFFSPRVSIYRGKKLKKYGHKTSAKILLRPHTDGEVHMLTS
jgi:hypothetical protein